MTNLGVYAYWPASFPHDMPSGSDKGTKKTSGHHPACISCHVLVASPSNKPDKGTPRRESRWPRRASLLPTAAAVMTITTIVSDISDTSAGSGPLGPLIKIKARHRAPGPPGVRRCFGEEQRRAQQCSVQHMPTTRYFATSGSTATGGRYSRQPRLSTTTR